MFGAERRFHGLDVAIPDPSDCLRQRTAHALQQPVRGAPQRARSVGVSSGGQQPREHVETPGDPAWILELLTERHRFGCLRARLVEVFPNDAQARGDRKQNAQAPRFTGAPMHLDRFIVELLRSSRGRRSTRRCWPGSAAGRHAPLQFARWHWPRLARLQSTRGSLLVVAEFKRGKPLKKQRERHDPCITVLAAQRQRLGATTSLDVTPLEVMHVRQTDQRPRPQRSGARTRGRERPFEPLPSLLEQPRLVQNQNSAPASSTPFSARDGDVKAHSSAARTFSCSIRSRRSHGS